MTTDPVRTLIDNALTHSPHSATRTNGLLLAIAEALHVVISPPRWVMPSPDLTHADIKVEPGAIWIAPSQESATLTESPLTGAAFQAPPRPLPDTDSSATGSRPNARKRTPAKAPTEARTEPN